MRGLFISFEGNDGSGKSSSIEKVYNELKRLDYNVMYTREPGGSKIAEEIRKIILDPENLGMDDWTEAYLYAASRREHVVKTILPALNEGKIVLCDRYIDSSLAYQGSGRKLGITNVRNLNSYATQGLLPDLTVFLCVRPEVGLERITKNRGEKDRLEQEKIDFHYAVYEGYQELLKTEGKRIVKINGECSLEEENNAALSCVMNFIKESNYDKG
jgi:dTMP kinase